MTAQSLTAYAAAGSLRSGYDWLAPAVEMAAAASGTWPLSAPPDAGGWTCFPKIATRTVRAGIRSVSACRDFAVTVLRRWDAAERSDDVVTVLSELLTNALRHALPPADGRWPGRPVRFGLLQPGPCVICAVADPSREPPVPRVPEILDETGRGLHVVDGLADAWGYTPPAEEGKVVWALFGLSGPAADHRYPDPERAERELLPQVIVG